MQSPLLHLSFRVVGRFLVDMGKPALPWCPPAQDDAFQGGPDDVVQDGGLVLLRDVFQHFDAHHPVVLRQPELRQDQVKEMYGTIRSFLYERRPVVRIVQSRLL